MSADRRPVADRVADVVFYGPLGFALDCRSLLPQLAQRGRRQIAFTRTIGRFTVRHGRQRIDSVLNELLPGGEELNAENRQDLPDAVGVVESPAPTPIPPSPIDPASADQLPIPQYDSLSAIQVVPRLDGMSGDELAQIAEYESATRSRRTILAKVAQLQR
jgi:hypothetical protein